MSAYIHHKVSLGEEKARSVIIVNLNDSSQNYIVPNGKGHPIQDHKAYFKVEGGWLHFFDRW